MSDYEPTDSDNDYDENEKILFQSNTRRQYNEESEEEVLGFDSSENNDDDDFEEDIETFEDDLPSAKAWGKRRKNFYNTDYVDKDFGGFQNKDAEAAEFEEQEARAIQERLLKELDETDYLLDSLPQVISSREKLEEKIKTDVSGLCKREKLALFVNESPEFAGLVEDFKDKMSESEKKLQPIISLINDGKIPNSPICKFIKTKYHMILNYCTNILYYLLLKARHTSVKSHPVIQRLFQYRQLLKQLETVDNTVLSQIDVILEKLNKGEKMIFETPLENFSRKDIKIVNEVIDENKDYDDNQSNKINGNIMKEENSCGDSDEGKEDAENARRAITYQIAKNRGLTPYRKKERRNPRVKHRMSYRKALIRRKGQVREVQREMERYGGEISGIKSGIAKSTKLK